MSPFSTCRATLLLAAALLLAPAAQAQRAAAGPPTQDPFGRPPAREVPPGRYQSHSYQNGVLTIKATDGSTRQVQPWAAGVVKISYFAPGRAPVADSSVSVVQPRDAYRSNVVDGMLEKSRVYKGVPIVSTLDALRFRIPKGNDEWTLLPSPEMVIDKVTLRISLLTEDDHILFSEASSAYRRQPTTPLPPGEETPPSRIDELAGTGVRFQLQPGERLYGTGSRALPLDRRGYRLELYNQAHYGYQNGEPALNVTLPVVLSSRGYMLLFDHYAAGYLDLGKQRADALEYGVEGLNSLSYFVITGSSQAEILSRYTALTGRQPLPPRWALGLIQSRFGYRSQDEMLDVARRMRAADFPLDALVLDLYWFGGTTRQGDFQWDATHFPDPAGMMRELKSQGVNTILISEPYVMRTSLNDSLVRTQGLVGTTATGRPFTVDSFWAGPASILDVFKPRARTWLWAQYQRLHAQGAAGWWSDLGEPENHPEAMHHALGITRQVHNAYGITWAQIFRDNYQRQYPNERLFNLARSGWAGMQRNAVFPWSGDISRTWSGLQAQVPIMLGMGQAGVGYMHSDAGGFGANATRDPELYTRWLQLAALGPILRPHSDQVVPPEPYTYPEPYRSIVRKYTHLRAELLPYLYTLAAENTLTGAPLTRAMDYSSSSLAGVAALAADTSNQDWGSSDAQADTGRGVPPRPTDGRGTPPHSAPNSATLPASFFASSLPNSQYLLGPSLLVAPVSQPGQRRRNVWLPATPGGWVVVESGETLPGGQLVGLPAPLGHIPLLARAGAFVPMTTYRPSTTAFRADTLEMRYYPLLPGTSATSNFTSYEDDGHSAQALAERQYATLAWTGSYTAPGYLLSLLSVGVKLRGTYPGAPTRHLVKLHVIGLAAAPSTVTLGAAVLPATAWRFDTRRHELLLEFPLEREATVSISSGNNFPIPASSPAAVFDPDAQTLLMPASRTFSQQAGLRYETFLPTAAPLRIRDARGRLVRELPTQAAAGPHALAWDGRDAQGRLVPLGYYDVELAGQHQHIVKIEE